LIAVDTSAIVTIFNREAEAERFLTRILADDDPVMSAASLLETSIVLRGLDRKSASDAELDEFISGSLRIVEVTGEQVAIARAAHARYGKGMGHRAQLNFGDCFSYALAKALDVPLLYKGADFAQTDIASAV